MNFVGIDVTLLADRYLQMRRSTGYTLRQQGQMFLDFAKFFQPTGAEHVSNTTIMELVTFPQDADRTWWYARLGVNPSRGFQTMLPAPWTAWNPCI